MSTVKAPFIVRIKNAAAGVRYVFKNPFFIVSVPITGFVASGIVTWMLNLPTAQYIATHSALSPLDKIQFFIEVHIASLTNPFQPMMALSLIIFGFLFGVNIALFVYAFRQGLFKKTSGKAGGAGVAAAALGSGCAACGTSLLAPVLAFFGATSSAFMVQLGTILNWLSIGLLLYSIYSLGGTINNDINKKKQ